MCVGFTNGYDDFNPSKAEDALAAMVPGSAISFDRIGYYHFAIFLGWAWPKGGDSDPIPLLCHLSGSPDTKPLASVRLDDFRDIVNASHIRVYKCSCSSSKRSEVILKCLWQVGKPGYNVVTNNCENFVREVITNRDISYQAIFTLVAPLLQLPRIVVGTVLSEAVSSATSSSSVSTSFGNLSSLGLISPDFELIEIFVTNQGLNLNGVKKNSRCTSEFFGRGGQFPVQKLFSCRSCDPEGRAQVCMPCWLKCHRDCVILDDSVGAGACSCPSLTAHAFQSSPIMNRISVPRPDRAKLSLPPELLQASEEECTLNSDKQLSA